MKQLAQYQDGRLELQEVPRPSPPPGGMVVRVTHSVISMGTEKMKVEQARMNLLQKARARPDQVRKVLDTARNLGWRSALEKVRNRLESPSPLGYSAAGVVVEVDAGSGRFRVGDRVACGGAECAFHAEYVAIPELLAAAVPDDVPDWQAAYTTLCSIGMHAVRQAEVRLGDRVMVLGQGLVGLLITNLLEVAGARVLAVDVLAERRQLCAAAGAEQVIIAGEQDLADAVRIWTGGIGVDAVILCTSGANNRPLEQAADALRDRGRLVVVGNTRADLSWRVFTEKEIEVRYSRSYGPGRYDLAYEWGGSDYPIGYVRWTEQRNFEACLHLMSLGQLRLDAITTRRVPFADAVAVYQDLDKPGLDVGIVLIYPESREGSDAARGDGEAQVLGATRGAPSGAAAAPLRPQPVDRLDVIGAGNFARTMLLPHLKGRIRLGTVVNQTALSGEHVRKKFGFEAARGDAGALLENGSRGAVLIATRHHLHAGLVVRALRRGRPVFVEKPLCLTVAELEQIDAAVKSSGESVVVGFNRRFAPASAALREALGGVPGARMASIRVMPGRLDPKHWYANLVESGGRVLGEACHFLDYFCFLFESMPVRVTAQTIGRVASGLAFPDSVAAQVEFEDGSCGQLVYSAEGDPSYPKEMLTVYAAGFAAEMVNFQELTLWRGRSKSTRRFASKGHAEEMAVWLDYLRGAAPEPLPYAASRRSMLLTFAVLESIRESRCVELRW